ncbi:MAG: glycosyltransferase family 9 protein [Cryomorphaceae bacterium]|jgi:ADP-heptose:LPS heptosyltransferase|nr:glycosyltransferase family 9 protein [Cryomorphaceae bacterium]
MPNSSPKRILIIRFSSIGDIVLTFTVASTIKSLYPHCTIDFVTKPQFKELLNACPDLDTIYTLTGTVAQLRKEIDFNQYDAILDLHHNLRSRILLGFQFGKVYRFPKNNIEKWLLTTFKIRPKIIRHVTERYLETLSAYTKAPIVGIAPAYRVPDASKIDIKETFQVEPSKYVAVAIGAQFATKRMPTDLLVELIQKINLPVLLLGAKEDQLTANEILEQCTSNIIFSAVGTATIHESAWLVKNAKALLTHDTGLMHIGASFEVPLHVIWGNTTRDFGMYPYRVEQEQVFNYEVSGLSCRPCSKIGHQSCPKGHFSCMRQQDLVAIANAINEAKA